MLYVYFVLLLEMDHGTISCAWLMIPSLFSNRVVKYSLNFVYHCLFSTSNYMHKKPNRPDFEKPGLIRLLENIKLES